MILGPLLRVRGDLELLFLLIGSWSLSVSSCRTGGSEGRCKSVDGLEIRMVLEVSKMAYREGKRVVADHHMPRRIVVVDYH